MNTTSGMRIPRSDNVCESRGLSFWRSIASDLASCVLFVVRGPVTPNIAHVE